MIDFNAIHPNFSERATSITVAQGISRVIDEAQEGLTDSNPEGLFLVEESDVRITEVSAELKTTAMPSGDVSEFTVSTSDGRTFKISVQEVQL